VLVVDLARLLLVALGSDRRLNSPLKPRQRQDDVAGEAGAEADQGFGALAESRPKIALPKSSSPLPKRPRPSARRRARSFSELTMTPRLSPSFVEYPIPRSQPAPPAPRVLNRGTWHLVHGGVVGIPLPKQSSTPPARLCQLLMNGASRT